jgi:hypothetical protein
MPPQPPPPPQPPVGPIIQNLPPPYGPSGAAIQAPVGIINNFTILGPGINSSLSTMTEHEERIKKIEIQAEQEALLRSHQDARKRENATYAFQKALELSLTDTAKKTEARVAEIQRQMEQRSQENERVARHEAELRRLQRLADDAEDRLVPTTGIFHLGNTSASHTAKPPPATLPVPPTASKASSRVSPYPTGKKPKPAHYYIGDDKPKAPPPKKPPPTVNPIITTQTTTRATAWQGIDYTTEKPQATTSKGKSKTQTYAESNSKGSKASTWSSSRSSKCTNQNRNKT